MRRCSVNYICIIQLIAESTNTITFQNEPGVKWKWDDCGSNNRRSTTRKVALTGVRCDEAKPLPNQNEFAEERMKAQTPIDKGMMENGKGMSVKEGKVKRRLLTTLQHTNCSGVIIKRKYLKLEQ